MVRSRRHGGDIAGGGRATAERATAERAAAERATAERAAAERATAERATAERAAAERATADGRGAGQAVHVAQDITAGRRPAGQAVHGAQDITAGRRPAGQAVHGAHGITAGRAPAGPAVHGAQAPTPRRLHGDLRGGGVRVLLASLALAWSLFALTAASTAAQAPTPVGPGGVAGPVDPRSSGEGPGLEAEPLIVLAGVVLLGLAAAGGTALFVRLTRDD